MVTGAYKPRNSKASALYRCVQAHFGDFEAAYPTRYQKQYGFYRPVIGRVVEKFLTCGDLTKGFARVRCDTCRHEYLLAFSCKGKILRHLALWPATAQSPPVQSIAA
jgi:hypothetical protein